MSEVIRLFLSIMGAFTIAVVVVMLMLIVLYEFRHSNDEKPDEKLYKTGYRDALSYMTYRGKEIIDTMETGDARALGVAMMIGIAESRLKYEVTDGTKETT